MNLLLLNAQLVNDLVSQDAKANSENVLQRTVLFGEHSPRGRGGVLDGFGKFWYIGFFEGRFASMTRNSGL